MKNLLILTLLMPVVAFAQVREDGSFRTILRGTVVDPDCQALYITSSSPKRDIDPKCIIPVTDGKFEYVLEGDYVQEYMLLYLDKFQQYGISSGVYFFPDVEALEFTMRDAENFASNTVSGGEANRTKKDFFTLPEVRMFMEREDALKAEKKNLKNKDLYYNEKYNNLLRQIQELDKRDDDNSKQESTILTYELIQLEKEKSGLTPEGVEIMNRLDELHTEMVKWQYEYIAAHPNLYSYQLFLKDISSYRNNSAIYDLADMERAYEVLSAANPGHPYNQKAADGLATLKTLSPGAMFIDFTAPELDGTMHTLSEEIKGKIAVINLWASWCGPCRKSGIKIIPIYEKYKDRGFTVVGVAREFKKTDDLVIALKRDGYPWLNLFELDDRAGIWMKYGAGNAGGRKILVDENGRIVKLDPTAEDIAKYLSSRLD